MQAAFFGPRTTIPADVGLKYLGITILVVSQLTFFLWFPMWGGMILPASAGADEFDFYSAEYTPQEIAEGKNEAALNFVSPESAHCSPQFHLSGLLVPVGPFG